MRLARLLLLVLTGALLTPAASAQTVPDTLAAPEPDAPPAALPVPRPRPRPIGRPLPRTGARRLSGPRAGITILSAGTVREINETFGECDYSPQGECRREDLISTSLPVVTQFGWQFERQMAQTSGGLAIITESVLLVGGLERGLALPSASLIVGVRTATGLELGVGPNLSATGAAYAITVGVANPVGEINVPLNAAVVLGRDGPRFSLLVGLTFSDDRY
ncbi:MAG TPA: hypothetical protein VF594_09655 [Rubricoccaceae bacterium]